ncbi:MAG TPA: phosphonate ABC transporter, permease protein PhnE [bacterium]|nr:phosphonate ABC transporter, permease protein PhnE [bacterium]
MSWKRRSTAKDFAVWLAWLLTVAVVVYCWKVMNQDTIWAFVTDAPRQLADISGRMLPPKWSYISELWKPLWDTLNIATLGTALGVLLAIPISYFAARNVTPSPKILRPLSLLLIVSSRSINSVIWALLLVSILGPGLLAGILAIALRSVGFVAKLIYEAIEEVDPVPMEAIVATGGSNGQVLTYAVVPQIMPAFAGISVFRWDINIRESAVLGLVGAGGIGLQLDQSLSTLAWPQVSLILLTIFSLVLVSEWVSAKIRHAII